MLKFCRVEPGLQMILQPRGHTAGLDAVAEQKRTPMFRIVMTHSSILNEVAIFSIGHFTFGVDVRQIEEIFTVTASNLPEDVDASSPFFLLRHHKAILPVFSLWRQFCLPGREVKACSSALTTITCRQADLLVAFWVNCVENILPVSFHDVKPVPRIMTTMAHKICLWGFWESGDLLLPLLDLDQLLSPQMIRRYTRQHSDRSEELKNLAPQD